MSTTETVHCFHSYEDAEIFITEIEKRTCSSFTKWHMKNHGQRNVSSLQGHRIWWEDKRGVVPVPYNGTPFVCLGTEVRTCHQGKNKKKKTLQGNQDHVYESSRQRIQPSKKMNCPAKIRMKMVVRFPQYKIDGQSSVWRRERQAQRLRASFCDTTSQEFTLYLKVLDHHRGHMIGELSGYGLPLHKDVKEKIVDFVEDGITNPGEIRRHLFRDTDHNIPLTNRRFRPTSRDIRNHVQNALKKERFSQDDQKNLMALINKWKADLPDDNFFFRPAAEECDTSQSLFLDHQSAFQRKLMMKYGQEMILMDSTYKTSKYNIPLFMLCVSTNVGYSPICFFLIIKETKEAISEALEVIKQWNPNWQPKSFMCDFDKAEISALENVFKDIDVYTCDFHREQAWQRWFSRSDNNAINHKESVLKQLRKIAHANTVEEYEYEEVSTLKLMDFYRESVTFQNWVEKQWLQEKKRWVYCYRKSSINIRVSTTNGVEALNKKLKHNYLKSFSDAGTLSGVVKVLIEKFEADCKDIYIRNNIVSLSQFKKYSGDIPSFLVDKPKKFVSHCLKRMTPNLEIKKENLTPIESGFKVASPSGQEYLVNLSGDVPLCTCADWKKFNWPCKHMLAIFVNFPDNDWNSLSAFYRSLPWFNLDETLITSLHDTFPPENERNLQKPENIDKEDKSDKEAECDIPVEVTVEPDFDIQVEVTAEPDCEIPVEETADLDCDIPVKVTAEPNCDIQDQVTAEPDCDIPVKVTAKPDCDVPIDVSAVPDCDIQAKLSAKPDCDIPVKITVKPDCDIPVKLTVEPNCLDNSNSASTTELKNTRYSCLSSLKNIQSDLYCVNNIHTLQNVLTLLKQVEQELSQHIPKLSGLPLRSTSNKIRKRRNLEKKNVKRVTVKKNKKQMKQVVTKETDNYVKMENTHEDVAEKNDGGALPSASSQYKYKDADDSSCPIQQKETVVSAINPYLPNEIELDGQKEICHEVKQVWSGQTTAIGQRSIGPYRISAESIRCINSFLSDEVIDAFLHQLASRHNNQDNKVCHLNCITMTAIFEGQIQIHHCLRRVGSLMAFNTIIGAYNQGGCHWCLIIIHPSERKILFLNPLGSLNIQEQYIVLNWFNFLKARYNAGLESTFAKEWTLETPPHARQSDGRSCGVYVLKFAESYLEGRTLLFHWSPQDVRTARLSLAVFLLTVSSESTVGISREEKKTCPYDMRHPKPLKRKRSSFVYEPVKQQKTNHLFCVCKKKNDGRTYWQCEGCQKWFHPTCIGKQKEDEPEVFYCPKCLTEEWINWPIDDMDDMNTENEEEEDIEKGCFVKAEDVKKHMMKAYKTCWDIVHLEGMSTLPWAKRHHDFIENKGASSSYGFGEALFSPKAIFILKMNIGNQFQRKRSEKELYSTHMVIRSVANGALEKLLQEELGQTENYCCKVLLKESMISILQWITGESYTNAETILKKTEASKRMLSYKLIINYISNERSNFIKMYEEKNEN